MVTGAQAKHARQGVESLPPFVQNQGILQSALTTFAGTWQGNGTPLDRPSLSGIICVARPRSSMDRVMDFESSGCAFDPRRGRSLYVNATLPPAPHPNDIRPARAHLRRFDLGASSQWRTRLTASASRGGRKRTTDRPKGLVACRYSGAKHPYPSRKKEIDSQHSLPYILGFLPQRALHLPWRAVPGRTPSFKGFLRGEMYGREKPNK